MNLMLPDPVTDYTRKVRYPRRLARTAYIIQYHPGFNLRYLSRISHVPARVDRIAHSFHWPHNQTVLCKALLMARMTCVFTDHLVGRLAETGLIPSPELHAEWEDQYGHFLDLFLRLSSPEEGREIFAMMQRLHHYTLPPARLIRMRRRHLSFFLRMLDHGPGVFSAAALEALMAQDRPPKIIAKKICALASVYADFHERRAGMDWSLSYAECMLQWYACIRKEPDLMLAIILMP